MDINKKTLVFKLGQNNNITDLENLGSGIDFEAISKLPSNVIFLSIFLQKLVTNLYHNIYTKKLA